MGIFFTLLRIFYAGTMAVYPNVGMFGNNVIQCVQAGRRLGNHFGLIKGGSLITPGPQTEQGNYAWWQDGMILVKGLAPFGQRLIRGSGK
ncbi:MAG: hypothetical protein M0Z55_06585 [Peptococcaceae bacterium]|nr:hypothetical protein [Peptococcaceae bacterium]